MVILLGCTPGEPPHGEPSDGSTGSSTTTTGSSGTSGSEESSGEDDSSTSSEGSESSTGTDEPSPLDETLTELLAMQEVPVLPLEAPEPPAPELVSLGEALFFDPILSGNRDIACASCHHPAHGSSDGLSLTLGTGATGVGPERAAAPHPSFAPRHAQSLFNIGHPEFERMFWDGRVERLDDGSLRTPAADALLPGLSGPLAAQAMFPVLDRQEMRGQPGDQSALGEPNELAELSDDDPRAVWAALMTRLETIAGYQDLFAAAYPDRSFEELTFADAANAIAAYQSAAFSFPSAPWDAYLAGDREALSDAAKLGAILFYGSAGCGHCHSGPLLTDHELHATGVPQLGPGKAPSAPFDYGRELVTGAPDDRFRFRTPSLRNVEVSAPYMHDGAHPDLQSVLVHYADPEEGITGYDPTLLIDELSDTVQLAPSHIEEMLNVLDEDLVMGGNFAGLSNIREFLLTLTDPAVMDLPDARPTEVPSGLDVP
jgi:cytochrome c peroxidase